MNTGINSPGRITVWLAALILTVTATAAPDDESSANTALNTDHPEVRGALALVDKWLDAYQAYEQIPAISVGVVHDQALIFGKGYGYANVRRKRAAGVETIYSICSISKLFTAVGVMQQRDAGRLRLSDGVEDHLAWFDIENRHPDGGPITVQSLLTHSSGLPRESEFPYWSAPDFPFPDRESMIARLREQETLYPASTYFQYSNLALTLAGEIVAATSGTDYDDYIQEAILDPLEMTATAPRFQSEAYGRTMAIGYSARDRDGKRTIVPEFDTRAIAPAAGFTSNVIDLAAFASWQFRLLEDGGSEVLRASTLKEMHRVHWTDPDWKTTWGLGFVVVNASGDSLVGHGGSCPGYQTSLMMMPDEKLSVIVMINAGGTDPQLLTRGIFKIIGPALKAAAKPVEQSAPDFSAYEGVYNAQPWGGESVVVQWGEKLLVTGLPSDDPLETALKLKHDDGHVFHRIREDGDTPGEAWVFQVDDQGQVTGVTRNSNTSRKLR